MIRWTRSAVDLTQAQPQRIKLEGKTLYRLGEPGLQRFWVAQAEPGSTKKRHRTPCRWIGPNPGSGPASPHGCRGRLVRTKRKLGPMKLAIIALPALALTLGSVISPAPAEASGCLKGALVGGVAGHYAGHHAILGAIGGCVVG